jgi:tetratricopeptide (TPR) repeat protein
MPSDPSDSSKQREGTSAVRLDSWKEIAAYLGRGERTAKRWESERSMPVHRVPGDGRGSVYALASELDEWLTSRRAQGLDEADVGEKTSAPIARNETSGAGGRDCPIAGHIAALAEHQLTANAGNLHAGRDAFRPGWKTVLAATLVVAVGLAAFAATHRSIIGAVPHRLSSTFGSGQSASVHPGPVPVSDEEKARAHELYLKGRYEWNQRTPDSLNRALDDFTQAIVRDPNSAEAYAGMADTYNLQRIFSTLPSGDMYSRAITAARRAVELDDSLAEGHRALAFAEVWGARNFPEGYKEFRRAIELNPKDPLVHLWFANALAIGKGTPEEENQEAYRDALEEISKAQELDPASHSILASKGIILYKAGNKDEGEALLKQVERADPGLATVHTNLAIIEFERGNYPAYLAESEESAELHNDVALRELTAAVRAGYAQGGERGLSKALFAKAESCDPSTDLPRVWRAFACVHLGKNQEALQLLEEANANHDPNFGFWFSPAVYPAWTPIENEPRFRALLKKINGQGALTQALASSARPSDSAHLRAASEQR